MVLASLEPESTLWFARTITTLASCRLAFSKVSSLTSPRTKNILLSSIGFSWMSAIRTIDLSLALASARSSSTISFVFKLHSQIIKCSFTFTVFVPFPSLSFPSTKILAMVAVNIPSMPIPNTMTITPTILPPSVEGAISP